MEQKTPEFPKEMMKMNIYKSKLQEFCHGKKWAPPRYTCMKDGADHIPQFKASVVVNGLNFDTLAPCKSRKEADNQVAKLAFLYFSSGSGEQKTTETHKNPDDNVDINPDSEQQYKKKLQIYAKRMKLGLPTYCVQREGVLDDLCFKATVSLSGESFKSLGDYKSAMEAEEDAARFALIVKRSYKSLLQELGQSKGLAMPAYMTTMSGKHHNLTFLSSVEIDGDVFHGTAAMSKKQAENNAAKVAYMSLMEAEDQEVSLATDISLESLSLSPKASDSIVDRSTKGTAEMKTYLLCNRFKVYNHIPDMALPKGTVLLPIRDGEWVVASLEFPNQK
nr:double-stranded RNA-binding protein 1-like [Ipomoea batatas]